MGTSSSQLIQECLAVYRGLPNGKHTGSSAPARHCAHACQMVSAPTQVHPLSTARVVVVVVVVVVVDDDDDDDDDVFFEVMDGDSFKLVSQ